MITPPHPLQAAFEARVRLLATTLRPATIRQYQYTTRKFMAYLREHFPDVRRPSQLRRDPHILGWLEHLWTRPISFSGKPLAATTRAADLIRLRRLFDLLGDHPFPPPPGLLQSQDIPRPDQVLPRPLSPEEDERLRYKRLRHNDLLSTALLLTRLTGMRIGETVDLAANCLRHIEDDQWALHVPVGKLHTERWIPVDGQVRTLVTRLQFLRTLPPVAPAEFLLPRPKGRSALCVDLRAMLSRMATQAGILKHIVPHQLRHTYATNMLRAGVSLPGLMKLLGHRTANMTLRYVEITQKDLQREFQMAQQVPRHQIPLPAPVTAADPTVVDSAVVVERLSTAARLLDLYRQQHSTVSEKAIQLLLRRLVRVRARFQKLTSSAEDKK